MIGQLRPNERAYGEVSLSVPSQEGYLILYADVAGEVTESNEVHNWKSQDFAGYADLVIENFQYHQETSQYSMVVRNVGNLSSTPTQLGAYLSFHETREPIEAVYSDILFNVPALEPGNTSETMWTSMGWKPPSSTGETWLYFAVDANDLVHERDEENNSTSPLWQAGSGQGNEKPDLIPDLWGFSPDIWPDPEPLAAPDVEISRLIATSGSLGFRVRAEVGSTPIQATFEGVFSEDNIYGNADDLLWLNLPLTISETLDTTFMLQGKYPQAFSKDYVRLKVSTNISESSALNNTAYTRLSLPNRMAVHSVTNQSNVACGPSTVAVYMSRDTNLFVSPNDDLICLYLHPGFNFGGTDAGPMIAYDGEFMDNFAPLEDWFMKFVVDATNAIDEADETNNVLVVDADPSNYSGPMMPRGLPPLPNPGPGTFNSSVTSHPTAAVHQVSLTSVEGSGLIDIAFQFENQSDQAIPIDNLSIFANDDLSLDTGAKLVFSSMLVGDIRGETRFPSLLPEYGNTQTTRYRLRIPDSLVGTPYKLIFVINGKKVIKTGDSELDPHPYLYFDQPDTRILGTVEPFGGQ